MTPIKAIGLSSYGSILEKIAMYVTLSL